MIAGTHLFRNPPIWAISTEAGQSFQPANHAMVSESIVYVLDAAPLRSRELHFLLASTNWRVEFVSGGHEFLRTLGRTRSACLLIELAAGDRAIEIQSELRARGIALPTIVIAGDTDVRTAVDIMQRGAVDLLQKPIRRADLLDCIRRALDRDREHRLQWARCADFERRWAQLTNVERAVVSLLIEGKHHREISAQLGCALRTVESRRANIMRKLGANSLAHLVQIIYSAGRLRSPANDRTSSMLS